MIKKIFIPNYNDVSNKEVRNRYGNVSGVLSIIINLILSTIKIIIGFISNSISIMADAVNNISDMVSSILTIIGFKLSNKKPNKIHPYGYARYEYIFGLLISLLMILMGVIFLKESVVKIINPEKIVINIYTFIILVLAIILKLYQMIILIDFAKSIDSKTLKTTALESRNDVISDISILISMIVMKVTDINIDGYLGLIVSIIVIISSISMLKEVIDPIIGIKPSEKRIKEIENKLLSYKDVIGYNNLIIHNYGVCKEFISVHIELNSKMNILKSNEIVNQIEKDFKDDMCSELTIHVDPVIVGNKKYDNTKSKIIKALKIIDKDLMISEFKIINKLKYIEIYFDCIVPYDKEYNNEIIINHLENNIKDKKKYKYFINIIRPYC